MPVFVLEFRADLDNIQSLALNEGNLFKLNISHEGETKEGITVAAEDVIELDGSKGEVLVHTIVPDDYTMLTLFPSKTTSHRLYTISTLKANFVMKWPGATQQSYIKLTNMPKAGKGKKGKDGRPGPEGTYASDSGDFVKMVAMECRGLEIDKWIVTSDFKATGLEGTIFDEVDLADEDGWCDYDEKNNESVSITNVETRVTKG